MSAIALLLVGSACVAAWGTMHIVKTGPVIAGFEPLTDDNRYVLRMEWIVEGVALVFVAALVAVVTLSQGPAAPGSALVYWMSAVFLLVMAGVSLFTGARASPLPYKLCAPIFTASAALIVAGALLA